MKMMLMLWVGLASMISGLAAHAALADAYSVKITVKITYKKGLLPKRMGSLSGEFIAEGDARNVRLVLGGREHVLKNSELGWRYDQDERHGGVDPLRPDIKLSLTSEQLERILLDADDSWYRTRATREHVAKMIEDYTANRGTIDLRMTYWTYFDPWTLSYLVNDESESKLDYVHPVTHERLSISFEIGHKVKALW